MALDKIQRKIFLIPIIPLAVVGFLLFWIIKYSLPDRELIALKEEAAVRREKFNLSSETKVFFAPTCSDNQKNLTAVSTASEADLLILPIFFRQRLGEDVVTDFTQYDKIHGDNSPTNTILIFIHQSFLYTSQRETIFAAVYFYQGGYTEQN